ncbi:CHC2 zinc finger [Salinimicrobium catena]|uniref:CHC2 zinc finger n=1 Tax=Salinimicrobium catena TaxID=390640 RepID=A0A1H5I6G2_9FLAO|nr:toprim domain-containing protein [Salinimicrobium catena]SDK74846.1 CHC2 zinc finger [Salinimicrobium catena]SEE35058.1 CHC2 zinc finger [Salinimicrobium catena]
MENNLLDWKEARQKSIVKVLGDFGVVPKKQTSKAAWYLSPLRTEKEASFCVTLYKNLWYDFGIAKGGNVIDLVMELKSCTAVDALRYLSSQTSFFFNPPVIKQTRRNSSIEVIKVKELQHPALIHYLKSRGISESTAKLFCKEVWYTHNGKTHFSIGLPNSLGGWELRNKFFKNSTAPKSYSSIRKGNEKLLLFEGMFDFLSLATLDLDLVCSSDSIVLNSLGFLKNSFQLLGNYEEINLYLDNDPAGRKAVHELKKYSIKDCSSVYKGFKDLNEKLMLHMQRF